MDVIAPGVVVGGQKNTARTAGVIAAPYTVYAVQRSFQYRFKLRGLQDSENSQQDDDYSRYDQPFTFR
jgi:hypothetical protein